MKTIRACIYYLVFYLWMPTLLGAQPYAENYDLITTRNGLPHNTIQSLLRDSRGFLWIGTYYGLCIYDGTHIRTYRDIFGTSGSDWQYAVDAICEDNNGNVWLGARSGAICCFNKTAQQFIQYYTAQNTPFGPIKTICQDAAGHPWFGDAAGHIGCYDGNRFRIINTGKDYLFFMTPAGKDSLLLVTHTAAFIYNTQTNHYRQIFTGNDRGIVDCAAGRQKLALITLDSSFILDFKTGSTGSRLFFNCHQKNTIYHKIIGDTDSGFFYTDGIFINHYNSNGQQTDSFVISDHSEYDRSEIVNCALQDNAGLLWMGTNAGLFKIDRSKYYFRKYSHNNIRRKISHNYIRTICAAGNDLWVGTREGQVNRLVYDHNASEYLLRNTYLLQSQGSTLFHYTINNLLQLHDKRILAASDRGVFALNKTGNCFIPFRKDLLPDSLMMIWSLMEDRQQRIWIGTHSQGLYILDPNRNTLQHYTVGDSNYTANGIWNIFRDSNDDIWLGTDNGLFRVVSRSPGIVFEKINSQDKDLRNVWDMREDSLHNIWIGTTGYGIYCLRADRRTVLHYNFLPVNVISAIVPFSKNELWISTVTGLYCYNIHNGRYTAFKENNGTISDDYNFKCAAVAANGELFFGSKTGMMSFFPAQVKAPQTGNAPVVITSVFVGNKDLLRSYNQTGKLRLDHTQNFFRAGFSYMDFSNPQTHHYRYRLAGFEAGWNYLKDNQAGAGYTNLPPGNYELYVEAMSEGSNWSSKRAVMQVQVIPALWQRTPFRVAVLVMIVLLLILAVYYRIRSLLKKEKKKNEINRKIAELELTALQAQMNPHFIFNTINAIQHYILHNDEIAANAYLSQFAQLMRLYLESSKNRYIKLGTEAELLRLYLSLEKLRFEDKFDYRVHLPEQIGEHIFIPSMLLQPFVENAIKHGLAHGREGGMLVVSFQVVLGVAGEQILVCTIDDNGIGRKKSAEINARQYPLHVSRGTELINERIRVFNFINRSDIHVVTTDKKYPQTGTLVTITIPISPPSP